METEEVWKAIPEWDGFYEVSNFGRVRSLTRTVPLLKATGKKITYNVRGRLLNPKASVLGYFKYGLYRNSVGREIWGHALVMMAFVGPRPDGLVINHIDGNRGNNRLENLEYTTQLENMRHAVRTGLLKNSGEDNWNAKATEAQIRTAYFFLLLGNTRGEAAVKSGLTVDQVREVQQGKCWKHLGLKPIKTRFISGDVEREIIRLYNSGVSQRGIERQTRCSRNTIRKICADNAKELT